MHAIFLDILLLEKATIAEITAEVTGNGAIR